MNHSETAQHDAGEVGQVQVPAASYLSRKYLSIERFISYFYQLEGIIAAAPASVLIIGVGDGVVPDMVRKSGIRVMTCDIDPELHPDAIADIRALPFDDGSFDVVCAFEVLEHLPFEESMRAFREMVRVSKAHILISVPHRRTGIELVIKMPFLRSLIRRSYVRLALRIPIRFPGFAISKQHYWEIDGQTTTLRSVRAAFRKECVIVREETPVLDMYRRFFTLKKRGV